MEEDEVSTPLSEQSFSFYDEPSTPKEKSKGKWGKIKKAYHRTKNTYITSSGVDKQYDSSSSDESSPRLKRKASAEIKNWIAINEQMRKRLLEEKDLLVSHLKNYSEDRKSRKSQTNSISYEKKPKHISREEFEANGFNSNSSSSGSGSGSDSSEEEAAPVPDAVSEGISVSSQATVNPEALHAYRIRKNRMHFEKRRVALLYEPPANTAFSTALMTPPQKMRYYEQLFRFSLDRCPRVNSPDWAYLDVEAPRQPHAPFSPAHQPYQRQVYGGPPAMSPSALSVSQDGPSSPQSANSSDSSSPTHAEGKERESEGFLPAVTPHRRQIASATTSRPMVQDKSSGGYYWDF